MGYRHLLEGLTELHVRELAIGLLEAAVVDRLGLLLGEGACVDHEVVARPDECDQVEDVFLRDDGWRQAATAKRLLKDVFDEGVYLAVEVVFPFPSSALRSAITSRR